MANKTGLSPWIDGLAVLQSVAKAVPVLGAPVEGSIEAVKQILQYTEVSRCRGRAAWHRLIDLNSKLRATKQTALRWHITQAKSHQSYSTR
jgi:hypothetical protein